MVRVEDRLSIADRIRDCRERANVADWSCCRVGEDGAAYKCHSVRAVLLRGYLKRNEQKQASYDNRFVCPLTSSRLTSHYGYAA